jgi:ABC-type sugar transport system permease subunit/ABC-type glycerol-3-phosphate transport system substrate-binding protein
MHNSPTAACRAMLFILMLLPAVSRAADSNVVLRFRYWGDFKEIAVIQQTIRAFEHDHPGVTVHGERIPPGDEYVQKLLVEQAAGLTPDVIFCGDNYAAFAGRGVLTDLKPYVRADPSVKLSDYYPQLIRAFSSGDKLYGLPRDIAPIGLVYYNKALFDKAHLPYPDGSWSWDYVPHPERGDKDFLTVAQKLTHHTNSISDTTFGYSAGDNGWTMDNFIYSSGAAVVDDVFSPTKLLYGDPRVVNAIQLTQDLMGKYAVSPSAVDLASSGVGSHELFAQGKLAMYVSGIWEVPRFRTEITDFDWDIAAFPAGPTGLHGVQTGWSGYGIASSSRHKAEAWELVKYLAGPVGLSNLAKSGLAQPAISRLADSPLWLDNNRPRNRKLTIEEVPWIHYQVLNPNWTELSAIITPKLQLVWNGTETGKQAVNQFLGPAQAKLDELNHPLFHPRLNWGGGAAGMLLVVLLLVGWVWQGARHDLRMGRKIGSREEARAGIAFISPWLIGAVVFLLGPMLVSLLLAFSSWDMISPARWIGGGNFAEMAHDDRFWKSLSVTLLYTLFSVPLGVAGSLALALLLNTKIKGQSVFRTLYYLPAVASAVAASLIWLRLFNPESGLLNNILGALHLNPVMHALGLTDPDKGYVNWLGSEKTALGSLVVMSLWGIGGGMVIYLAGLQGIPQSYYEAAEIDGASVWQRFRHVTLPLLTPTIFFTLIMGIIGSFQVFTQGFVMTQGGPNNATLFYVLYLYQNAFQFLKMGYASALAWVLFLIILGFTAVQMKLSGWVHYEGEAK